MRQVVRLMGGDAFVLGWGSGEALALKRRGIAIEIVPGVNSAAAYATCSGLPLTHRGLSRGMRCVAEHARGAGLGSLMLVFIGRMVALVGELDGCGPAPAQPSRPDEVTA